MHFYTAATDEWRPEEPQQNALDKCRHKLRRVVAPLARPDRPPESARSNADDANSLRQIAADVIGELTRADVFVLTLRLNMTRRIKNDIPTAFERARDDIA